MEEFLKTERKLLEIPIHLEDIETICSKIKQSQLGPSPNDILYLIYTCFVTQAFKRFNNRKLYAKACILSLEQESDVFYEEDMLISFDIWRNLRFRCNTFDQAYHRLMVARNLISPNLEGIMSDLFDLQYEYKMLEGLRYFFD
ncbi:hypothetical protein TUBRATIS_30950 [Tubulinosema ratisbonensis]|uniref:Uncharacterized protein n=1 Tax=Tubulinosema ratisbonensis TaxID=291195 RepID=A0A437AH84_9MICR|nr:hypothetical protein TUBRATIS_30950 [Tubulinosema ratisbonensis]